MPCAQAAAEVHRKLEGLIEQTREMEIVRLQLTELHEQCEAMGGSAEDCRQLQLQLEDVNRRHAAEKSGWVEKRKQLEADASRHRRWPPL